MCSFGSPEQERRCLQVPRLVFRAGSVSLALHFLHLVLGPGRCQACPFSVVLILCEHEDSTAPLCCLQGYLLNSY